MKKRWAFTGAACLLAALFLAGVLAVGGSSGWFGLQALAAGGEPDWQYAYQTTWDPGDRTVEGLRVSWGNGPVELRQGQGALVTVTEYAARPLEEDERLALSFSGGALEVAWDGGLLPLGGLQNWQKRLVVEVPQAIAGQLEELSCGNTSGDIALSGFTAEEAKVSSLSGSLVLQGLGAVSARLSTVSGDVALTGGSAEDLWVQTSSGAASFNGVYVEEFSVKTDTGQVGYSGAAQSFTAQTVTGPVWAQLSACPQEADLRSASGKLTLLLPEGAGFEADYSSLSGGFSSDFAGSGGKGRLVSGTGGGKLSFTTTSGDIRLVRAGS